MSRRDLITIDGVSNYGLNVFGSVGAGGANNPGDVMVVQAMFRYLHDIRVQQGYLKNSWMGLDLEPNGILGHKTIMTILNYQRHNWSAIMAADGVIHPAKYENRKLTVGNGKRLMTITYLHFELWLAEDTAKDYTQEIGKKFLNVAFWIR